MDRITTSTPINRRLVELADEIVCSPLVQSDDNTERTNRRSIIDAEHRLSTALDTTAIAKESVENMTNHIKMCQTMFNQNKINVRNAWDMKVIDYINYYVSKNTLIQSDIVEVTRLLELCVTVYGYKVEYLAQEIMKLVSTVKVSKNNQDNSITEDNGQDETANGNKAKRKKSKRQSRPTIVKDRRDVLLQEIPKVAPIDFVSNIDIHASRYQNKFTNKIPRDHRGYGFNLLNNVDHAFVTYNAVDPISTEMLPFTPTPKITNFEICSDFKHFHIDEEQDQMFNESISSIMSQHNHSVAQPAITSNTVVYDDDGLPIPELDGSRHDIFADNDNDIIEDNEVAVAGQIGQKRIEVITSFCPDIVSLKESSFVSRATNGFLETVWVGPSHWRNKLIRPSVPRYSGKSDKKVAQVKRKRKVAACPENIEFDLHNIPPSLEVYEERCKTTIISLIRQRCTLPPHELSSSDFSGKLTQKVIPQQTHHLVNDENEFEHSPYDYNNANDSQYCSQADLLDDSGNAAPCDNQENDLASHIGSNSTSVQEEVPVCLNTPDALIDAPDLVPQIYIPYALRAKHINMKKLKSTMWECLQTTTDNHNVCNGEAQRGTTSFSEIYNQLPSRLSKKGSSEIGPAVAFFCLLHLTNENNLKLVEYDSLKNVRIQNL